jgi:hypothetical protein
MVAVVAMEAEAMAMVVVAVEATTEAIMGRRRSCVSSAIVKVNGAEVL